MHGARFVFEIRRTGPPVPRVRIPPSPPSVRGDPPGSGPPLGPYPPHGTGQRVGSQVAIALSATAVAVA